LIKITFRNNTCTAKHVLKKMLQAIISDNFKKYIIKMLFYYNIVTYITIPDQNNFFFQYKYNIITPQIIVQSK